MYLRFTTEFTNKWNETQTGVFQALGHLIDSSETFDYDKQKLNDLRSWFNSRLEKPARFNKHSNKNKSNIAISWFKDTATQHLEKMFELIPIFENYNLHVEVIKRENPGYKIFEDEFQIVTIPHGKEKSQVL